MNGCSNIGQESYEFNTLSRDMWVWESDNTAPTYHISPVALPPQSHYLLSSVPTSYLLSSPLPYLLLPYCQCSSTSHTSCLLHLSSHPSTYSSFTLTVYRLHSHYLQSVSHLLPLCLPPTYCLLHLSHPSPASFSSPLSPITSNLYPTPFTSPPTPSLPP